MRILRRRLSLRYLILIGVFIIFVLFLMTIRQFDQVETDQNYEQYKRSNKFRGHIRKPILNNENDENAGNYECELKLWECGTDLFCIQKTWQWGKSRKVRKWRKRRKRGKWRKCWETKEWENEKNGES